MSRVPSEWREFLSPQYSEDLYMDRKAAAFHDSRGEPDDAQAFRTMKTVAAFVNTAGGEVLIGVEDDGTVVGVEKDAVGPLKTYEVWANQFDDAVRRWLNELARTLVSVVPLRTDGPTAAIVQCAPSPTPVELRRRDKDDRREMYVRRAASSSPVSAADFAVHWGQRSPHTVRLWLERLERRAAAQDVVRHGRPRAEEETGALRAPALRGIVPRPILADPLADMCREESLITIEGLGGTGKTFLLAGYLKSHALATSTLWYDAVDGATLDDAMTLLGAQVRFSASSDRTRARELVYDLVSTDRRLVVDDYHLVDGASFEPLLDAASRESPPVRVIVVSRPYVELPPRIGPSARMSVAGLDRDQIRAMLVSRGIDKPRGSWVRQLEEKVGGLPLAVTLFATAVLEQLHDPDELLAGTMLAERRLKAWFDDVMTGLRNDACDLLSFLAAAEGPFGRGVVRMAGNELGLPATDGAFAALQRARLVEPLALGRWSVHQLIAAFAQMTLDPVGTRAAHAAFARFLVGVSEGAEMTDDERLATQLAACRHHVKAGELEWAQRRVSEIAAVAKAAGHYDALSRVCEQVVGAGPHDLWLDYHLAQCSLALGRLCDADRALNDVAASDLVDEPRLRLALARLDAELLSALGLREQALRVISDAVASWAAGSGGSVWEQAVATEARIRLSLGDADSVARLAGTLVARALREQNPVGEAIGRVYLGHTQLLDGDARAALASFRIAVRRLAGERRRGLAWAQSGLALALMAVGEDKEAILVAHQAIRTRSDVGECTPDYLTFLEQVREQYGHAGASSLITDEITRVETVLTDERARWRRDHRRPRP